MLLEAKSGKIVLHLSSREKFGKKPNSVLMSVCKTLTPPKNSLQRSP